jgi:plastocyanin
MRYIFISLFALTSSLTGLSAAGDLHVLIKDQKNKLVEDAVLLAIPTDNAKIASIKPKDESVEQIDKEFVPYVKPVFVGSRVYFPNKDNVRHHVYSFSTAKTFELQLYSEKSAPPVLLDKPGIVVLGCNIHDWMLGYVYVSETPYFAKSKADGTAVISNLPAGEYTLRLWHPGMGVSIGETGKRVTISDNPIQMDWQTTIKQVLRIPRKTSSQSPSYP